MALNGNSNFERLSIADGFIFKGLRTHYMLPKIKGNTIKLIKYVQAPSHLPILRRSAAFFLGIKSSKRPVDLSKDILKIVFAFGTRPNVAKGTKVVIRIDPSKTPESLSANKDDWDACVHRQSGLMTILRIRIGSGTPVGSWKCSVLTSLKYQLQMKEYESEIPFHILFNPYSEDDSVYMRTRAHLNEYLLNDVGKVYQGSYKTPIGRDWAFGQFEAAVLPAAFFLLDKSQLRPTERGNPIKVSRAISAMVNHVDDRGVLVGRWHQPYDEGTAPWEWSGSVKILDQYMQRGGQPVKYGQCWVFSAVTVTVCRALGIPCRSVTNYVSAHDTNQTLTIDYFHDKDGEDINFDHEDDKEYFGSDSIWNFHVWNEVFMARPDLPTGYGGWQVIDATPQEASENRYQCGPASIEAIRRGEVGFGFDVPFVFAEVNADVCRYVEDPYSSWGFTKSETNEYRVGKLILTKARGSNVVGDAEDITGDYKHKDGSNAERLAVYNAIRGVDRARRFHEIKEFTKNDVIMSLEEIEMVKYGQPYSIRVKIHNVSNKSRTLKVMVKSSSVQYNGVSGHLIRKSSGEFVMGPGQRDSLALSVSSSEYIPYLLEYCLIKINAVIQVQETHQFWSAEDDFALQKPKLTVQSIDRQQLRSGRMGRIRLSFRNPLEVALTSCRITLESPGAFTEIKENIPEIPPQGALSHDVLVNPRQSLPNATIVATFSAQELLDVHGSLVLDIE